MSDKTPTQVLWDPRRKRVYFHVAPRYSPGSPALVDEATARKVAAEERKFYQHALEGAWGAAEQTRAKEEGLARIVYMTYEGKKAWVTKDLITDEVYTRPFQPVVTS